jgi:hypothetical protein
VVRAGVVKHPSEWAHCKSKNKTAKRKQPNWSSGVAKSAESRQATRLIVNIRLTTNYLTPDLNIPLEISSRLRLRALLINFGIFSFD